MNPAGDARVCDYFWFGFEDFQLGAGNEKGPEVNPGLSELVEMEGVEPSSADLRRQ